MRGWRWWGWDWRERWWWSRTPFWRTAAMLAAEVRGEAEELEVGCLKPAAEVEMTLMG